MRLSVADVLARLEAEGLATEAAREPARAALQGELQDHLPWYLRAAIGFGAWLATALFLGFLLTALDIDQPATQLPVGSLLVALCVWQYRATSADFARHAAVAAGLAGFGLIIAALYDALDMRVASVLVVLISATLIRFVPDAVFRFLATLAMAVAIYAAIVDERSSYAFELVTVAIVALAAFVWRYRIADRGENLERMLRPAGYALVLAVFAALLVGMSTHLGRLSFESGRFLVVGRTTTIGIMVASLALVWKILDEQGTPLSSRSGMAALLGVVALGASTLTSPGISAGAAVLVLAFDRRDKVLLGMAIAFLLVFGSVYYYSLHLTLLEKSGVLAGSGALLLAIRAGVTRA